MTATRSFLPISVGPSRDTLMLWAFLTEQAPRSAATTRVNTTTNGLDGITDLPVYKRASNRLGADRVSFKQPEIRDVFPNRSTGFYFFISMTIARESVRCSCECVVAARNVAEPSLLPDSDTLPLSSVNRVFPPLII